MSATTIEPTTAGTRRWTSRVLGTTLVAALLIATVAAFFTSRRLIDQQEGRALTDRAATLEATFLSSEQSTVTGLRLLGNVASSSAPGALAIFTQVAHDQLQANARQGALGVGALRRAGGTVRVVAGDGTLRPGTSLGDEQQALIARASRPGVLVAGLFHAPRRVAIALAVRDVVVLQESALAPQPTGAPSPFAGLDIALYTAPTHGELFFASKPVPFHGRTALRRIPVGTDTWLLVVTPRASLVGTFTARTPWLVLGTGLLATALAALVVATLARRRRFAEAAVTARTHDLEEARAFQERLLTAGPVIVSRSHPGDKTITYVSPNVHRLLGLDAAGLGASPIDRDERIHPADRPAVEAAASQVEQGFEPSATVECRVRCGDGTYRWVSNTLLAERDGPQEAVTGVLSYVLDVDDRRTAEEELRASREVAESANRAKNEFLSRMSHELRTPLNAVLGFGQLLERAELTSDQRESVGYILKAGRHLLLLIDEVLDISRIEAGTMSLSPEPVDPYAVVGEVLALVQPLATTWGVRLRLHDEHVEAFVLADHQRLKQVLLNLLSNAVKYNVRDGEVVVGIEHLAARRVRINVTDTGPGIAPEQQALLFEPFQRLGAESSAIEGTGIGLALSRQLAEAMHGRLDVSTTLGHGSTFWVELPEAARPYVDPPAPAIPHRATEPYQGDSQYVLQIEDNPSNARLMERLLRGRPHVELIVAGLGRLGIDLAREHLPALILLDLHLPDLSGEDVLKVLKSEPATAEIPVVIVSADGTHGQERRLRAAGAADYLTKPFDVDQLLDLVDEAVSVA